MWYSPHQKTVIVKNAINRTDCHLSRHKLMSSQASNNLIAFEMTELGIRNSAIRSIRNVLEWLDREHAQPPLVEDYEQRLERIQGAFDRFSANQHILVQRAIEEGNDEEEEQHHQLLDQTEEDFMTTRARLLRLIRQLQAENPPNEPSRENGHELEQEMELPLEQREIPNNSDHQSLIGESLMQIPDPAAENLNGNRASTPIDDQHRFDHAPQENAPLQSSTNQGRPIFYVQCHGASSGRIENTWGEFDGTLSKFQGFHDRFKWAVYDKPEYAPSMKFQALWRSLKGKALEDLGEWSFTDVEYVELWDRLKELYQRGYHTSSEILNKFTSLKKVERASGPSLQKLSNVTNEVIRQLRALDYPIAQWDLMFVHGLHSKLDAETSRLWEMQRISEKPTAKDMLKFLDRQAKALCGSSAPETKTFQENKKRPWPQKNDSSAKRFKTGSESSSKHQSTGKDKCPVCKKDPPHTVFHCDVFKGKDLPARKRDARDHKLCFNCLRQSHTSAECKMGNCKRCDKKHNSLLCPENPNNRAVNTVQKKGKRQQKKADKPTKTESQ